MEIVHGFATGILAVVASYAMYAWTGNIPLMLVAGIVTWVLGFIHAQYIGLF